MPANEKNDPLDVFGRKRRSGLEQMAGNLAPKLTFDIDAQNKAAENRFENAFSGVARSAALEGSGLSTGFSGANIRQAGTLGAGLAAEKGQIERQAGAENRANFQTLLGAQGQEDQRTLRDREFKEGQTQFDRDQKLRSQTANQQFGLQKRGMTEQETSGEAQRRLSEAQVTGTLQGESVDPSDLIKQLKGDESNPLLPENIRLAESAGFRWDAATGKFIRERDTLGKASLTGDLGGQGVEDERTLQGEAQDVAAIQAQSSIELAERQRIDARDAAFQQLGIANSEVEEKARQFDATLLQQATEFTESFGMSEQQFNEAKRQFDQGTDFQNADLQRQMNQFNATTRLQAAELFGGNGISKAEFSSALNAQQGDAGYRRDLDFNKDGLIDTEDLTLFDSMANKNGVIEGQGTLAQRQADYQEARFESEIGLQSKALGIEEAKIRSAFAQNQQQIDNVMARFNSEFSGMLFNQGPDGLLQINDQNGDPLESDQHKLALQNLNRVEKAMDQSITGLAVSMGLLKRNEPITKLGDEQAMAVASMLFANRAPASPGVGFSGSSASGAAGPGFLDNMLAIGNTVGKFIPAPS